MKDRDDHPQGAGACFGSPRTEKNPAQLLVEKNAAKMRAVLGYVPKFVYVSPRMYRRIGADIVAGVRVRVDDRVALERMYFTDADEMPDISAPQADEDESPLKLVKPAEMPEILGLTLLPDPE